MFARIGSMVASFLIVPFIISALGLSGFGIWESIIAITAFATLILTSVSQTLIWRISISYGAKDIESVKEWFKTGIFLTLVQIVVIVPLIYLFRWKIIELFGIPNDFLSDVAMLLPIVTGIILIGGIQECTGAVLSGFQKSGYVILYKSIAIIIGQIVSVFFLFLGYGLVSIALGLVANIIIAILILNWKTKILITDLSFIPRIITIKQIKIVDSFFLLTLIGAITLLMRNHISKLILGSMASQESVAYYGIASRISGLVYLAVTFIMIPTITAVSSAFSRNENETIKSIYSETLSTFSFLNNLITLLLCVLLERLLIIWIGFYTDGIINFSLILIVGQSIAVLTTAIGVSVCTGIGRREIETYYIVFNLLLNIIVLVILVKLIGPIGSVIACSATWAISGFFFLFVMHKKIDIPQISTKKSLLSLSLSLILVIFFRSILSLFPPGSNPFESIFEFVIIVAVVIPIYLAFNKLLKLTPTMIPILLAKARAKITFKR